MRYTCVLLALLLLVSGCSYKKRTSERMVKGTAHAQSLSVELDSTSEGVRVVLGHSYSAQFVRTDEYSSTNPYLHVFSLPILLATGGKYTPARHTGEQETLAKDMDVDLANGTPVSGRVMLFDRDTGVLLLERAFSDNLVDSSFTIRTPQELNACRVDFSGDVQVLDETLPLVFDVTWVRP
ncbi:MAG: hypothetical protein ABIK45_14745 [Pseudomonadota bacterium]